MRILICDDDETYILPLREHLDNYMSEHNIPCEIITSTSSQKIAESKEVFDIAILDIQLPEIDGLALANNLRGRNRKTALFFVTNFGEYQDDAMDLQALRYFTKPFDPARLDAGLDKALEYINGAYVDLYLYSEGTQKRVLVDDILYVTLENRKIVIKTNKKVFYVTGKLEEWIERFPHSFFRQVHKSFLVNLHHVDTYGYSELIMTDGVRIPVANKKQAEFRRVWFEYLGRR